MPLKYMYICMLRDFESECLFCIFSVPCLAVGDAISTMVSKTVIVYKIRSVERTLLFYGILFSVEIFCG